MERVNQPKIGIYAGTFDPVHTGHIAFALQAIAAADLDMVYFLPERQPRYKQGVTHYGHRVAMIRRAVQPYPNLDVLEMPDACFSVKRTLPRLRQKFSDAQFSMLFGADVLEYIGSWPYAQRLLQATSLIVSTRSSYEQQDVRAMCKQLGVHFDEVLIVSSLYPEVSSSQVRQAVTSNSAISGLLASVCAYAKQQWLYTNYDTSHAAP